MLGKARIKPNRRFFNFIVAANKYIKIFIFEKDCFCIQINTIENYKKSISIRSTTYARLATKLLFDWSWKESRWIKEQFIEVLELLLTMKLIVINQKNRSTPAFQTIAKNWRLSVTERIKEEFKHPICSRHIASVLFLFITKYAIA